MKFRVTVRDNRAGGGGVNTADTTVTSVSSAGPFIITATYQVIENVLANGMNAADAVSAPRWHHQWQPPVVSLEKGDGRADTLAQAGYPIRALERPFCAVQVVVAHPDEGGGGRFEAASDPRKFGEAVVLP